MILIHQRESVAPSAPASGHFMVYMKTDGLLYLKDDAGNEYSLCTLVDCNVIMEQAIILLRSWVAGNGDTDFVTVAQKDELIEASGKFLAKLG